ncbi:MAG TPA: proton-conducting transporter membrane subunit [Vicinamibacterales bacterium]|nr:proton-conducting transporter membrane subunit [Vicinamibacterales bacterium]
MSAFGALLTAFVALCGVGAVLAVVLPSRHAARIVAWIGAIAAVVLIAVGATTLAGAPASSRLWTLPSVGAILIGHDALSGVFVLVTGLVLLPASIFTATSLPPLAARYSVRTYAVLFFALAVAVVWILVAADVFSFLVAWELMSVLSYLLVVFEDEVEAHRRAAYLMLAMSEAGFLAALAGLLLLSAGTGSLAFDVMRGTQGLGTGVRSMIFLLTFFGFGVKAGLVPVNVWLPRAYAAAPSAFVPVLAGITLNLGLYGIFRVNADLLPVSSITIGLVALVVGTLSALVGILYATSANDLKVVLAHSSIENAGIITAAMGAGFVFTASARPMLAAVAFLVALYHLVNHSFYKTLLFVGAGVVADRAGTRDLDRLGGLIRRMPWTAAAMLAGVLSIAALPPFNGFVSEWLTLQTMLRAAELSSTGVKIIFALCGAGLALTAALAVTCFAKVFAMGFLGMTRSPEAEAASEPRASALAPMAVLAVLCLLCGVLPTYVIGAIDRAVQPIAHASAAEALVPPFFVGQPGHDALPAAFASEFHDLGANVGQGVAPGPGLVILHRGGTENPVVFAASPTDLAVMLALLLLVLWIVVRYAVARQRAVVRRVCWDGGIRRLLPEMTYTATGFSNPVRVIFQAVYRPTSVEDTRETVARHFRTAIRRPGETVHILDRLVLQPVRAVMFGIAGQLARIHHGRLNAYMAYALLLLLVLFGVFASL